MSGKRFAIYVEGQTEQLFLNKLIKEWWCYTEIEIINLQMYRENTQKCEVPNYSSDMEPEYVNLFLIIDLHGEGSLSSGVAKRANKQHEQGYQIIVLRDLYAKDYQSLPHKKDAEQTILEIIKSALKRMGCISPEKIEVFFAVMEIEAWLLAFPRSLSIWAKSSSNLPNLEATPRPSLLMESLGKSAGKGSHKSFHEISSFISSITREDIEEVYNSNRVPRFNRFWQKIINLTS